ncbi:MAG: hypothetical protein ACK5PG_07870 [Lysobacterales bacterium]
MTLRWCRLQAGQRYDCGSGAHNGNALVLSVDGRNSQPLSPTNPYTEGNTDQAPTCSIRERALHGARQP